MALLGGGSVLLVDQKYGPSAVESLLLRRGKVRNNMDGTVTVMFFVLWHS